MSARKKPARKRGAKKAAPAEKRKRRNPSRRVRDPRETREWPSWVMAARDIILGASQEAAAAGISKTGRTLRYWMQHPAWAEAEKEAYDLCLRGLLSKSIQAVDTSVGRGNAQLGWEIMQRMMKQLTPVSKHEVTGKDGGPVEHVQVHVYMPDNDRGGS